MEDQNEGGFYDKVAKRFGEYRTGSKFTKEFLTNDPEAVFVESLLKNSGPDKKALDIGSADGRFTLMMSKHFGQVVGIDMSAGMITSAKQKKSEVKTRNVEFVLGDASKMPFADDSFNLLYSRRGPTFYQEFARVLKPGGEYIEIGIGEKDCLDIKELFGRGQNFGKKGQPILNEHKKLLAQAGFKITTAGQYSYNEYYPTYQDLELFLQGVPIFEDFDPVKDKEKLEEYVKTHTTPKGIVFPRHRIVISARKT